MLTTMTRTARALFTFTALGCATLGIAGCDQDGVREGAVTLRTGGVGGITFNTSNWVSAAARDVYEFDRTGAWRTNSFGFEVRLQNVAFDVPGYGTITTNPSSAPSLGAAWVEITGTNTLAVKFHSPAGDSTTFSGPDLVGLRLLFNVKYAGSNSYNAKLKITDHTLGSHGGDFFEFVKIDPNNGSPIAAICETSTLGDRNARVYGNISVDAITGAITEPQNILHISCTAAAPAKSSLYGYIPNGAAEAFRLVNRIIRADYCADGYPFTYPGNSLLIRDNYTQGQEGQTLAQARANAAANGAVLEAVWDEHGIVCLDTPRVDNLDRGDVVCPVKTRSDGTTAYNWQPPPCDSYVEPAASATRFYSLTAID